MSEHVNTCKQCGKRVTEHRVYFGVVGPFCNTDCREEYLKVKHPLIR